MHSRQIPLLLILIAVTVISGFGQSPPSGFERDRARTMLNIIKNDIKKNYYDPNFHGIDLDTRFKEAEEKIKVATSQSHILGIIAQATIDLNDSHTYFIPPSRPYSIEYGWQMQMV